MTEQQLALKLNQYLPESTGIIISRWIIKNEVHFRVTKPRNSKFGDYRHPWRNQGHMITVNGDLNQWAFLITTIHEFAHLLAWIKYKNTISPHGKEWKTQFKLLLDPFIRKEIFPKDLEFALIKYIADPSASSCVDAHLTIVLKKYDAQQLPFLEELPKGTLFNFNGRNYIKGEKLRSRYRCVAQNNRHEYFISGLAEVQPL